VPIGQPRPVKPERHRNGNSLIQPQRPSPDGSDLCIGPTPSWALHVGKIRTWARIQQSFPKVAPVPTKRPAKTTTRAKTTARAKAKAAAKPAATGPQLTPKTAAKQPFMATVRELVRTYQAFDLYSDAHIRSLGLTSPQFDVICTLGNTPGLLMHQLAEKTLVTKGTLTGIVNRLEQKDLVRREVPENNRRCFVIVLTAAGEALFESIFPDQISHLSIPFERLSAEELAEINAALKKLRAIF
jgi:MarR family transcriptional regulator, 2-MHQ and catechol-resistance regulon repressor